MKRIIPFLSLLFTLLYFTASAQNGRYTIRLVEHDRDCGSMKYYVDLEIKASSAESHFFIASQNYRFSFDDTQLANPQIDMELDISGEISTSDSTVSHFDPHNLNGSIGGLISYNIIGGGNDFSLTHDAFSKVGRLSFDLLDPDADIRMNIHTAISGLQPTNFIMERIGLGANDNIPATEGPCYDLFSSKLNLFVFLEGALDTTTGRMSTKLNEYGLLPGQTPIHPSAVTTPEGHPFGGSPWNHPTVMSITDYDETVVDWVLISIREDQEPTYLFKSLGLLHDDGHIEMLEPIDWANITSDSIYVSVHTRGNMAVMSHKKIKANCRSTGYDFRFQNSYSFPAFGQIEISPGIFGMFSGDLDHLLVGVINGGDISIFTSQSYLFNLYSSSDFNLDGEVNFKDYFLISKNNGKSSPIHE